MHTVNRHFMKALVLKFEAAQVQLGCTPAE
jgi:hypothetical protein